MASITAIALGAGGAVAGSLITSAQIKDNTIKSVDVKNKTLKVGDLANAAVTALKGRTGPAGRPGATGPPGADNFDPAQYYDRTASDGRFIDTGESAFNADLLDGLDNIAFQRRVSGTCADTAIGAVSATGTVTCRNHIAGFVLGNGNAGIGGGFTVTRTAVGQYDIQIPPGTFASLNILPFVQGLNVDAKVENLCLGGSGCLPAGKQARVLVDITARGTNTLVDGAFFFHLLTIS